MSEAERSPLLMNVRWGQVIFGALLGALALDAYRATGEGTPNASFWIWRGVLLAVAALGFWVYLQNMYRYGLVPDYSLKCRFCNGPVNRYSEFCEHCGGDLIADEKLVPCPKCGVELYEGTKHCPECGARVSAAKAPKKPKKANRQADAPTEAGWSTPVDAVSGFPEPGDERPR